MEQQIVNELYWPPEMDAAFTFGSTVRVQPNDEVSFDNRLMTAGVMMKSWSVAVNYQGSKITVAAFASQSSVPSGDAR